jgi:7tm Odorant receptor.
MELLSPSMIKFLGVEEHYGANKLLQFNLHRLCILGVWKWDAPQWRLHKTFAFLTIISLILCDITLICDAYIYITDLERLAKLLLSTIFTGLLAFKNTYLLIRTDKASELIDQLQNKFFTDDRLPTSQQTMILNRYAARAKLYTIIRSNLAFSIAVFWVLYPIKEMLGEYTEELHDSQDSTDLKSNNNRTVVLQLPYVAYYPYDVEHNVLNFILTYFFESFIAFSVFVGMPAWDMLFVSVFIHTSGHFKALQHVLIHLRENAREALKANMNQLQLQEAIRVSEQIDNGGSSVWTMVHHSEEHTGGMFL